MLKALGIRLTVADFDTGYYSMAYLSNLPINTLKIDCAFVGQMSMHTEDAASVGALVMLAKTLNLSITSESIEPGGGRRGEVAHVREAATAR